MDTIAVLLREPEKLELSRLALNLPTEADVVVDIEWSGISTGTERLLWSGKMPHFPGMGYPLVPGYESVGLVSHAGAASGHAVGSRVFVPGARCFGDVRGLFGGAAARLVVPGSRATRLADGMERDGVLLALAGTAQHALAGHALPELIVGHGVLGRLLARLVVAHGGAPTVWETQADRREGARGYQVIDPAGDTRQDYRGIVDVSGDSSLLEKLILRLAPRHEIVLAGFYSDRLSFPFPPAFMREVRIRIAAEWQPQDLVTVNAMLADGRLALDGLITHSGRPADVNDVYRTAFTDPACLKMVLDWRVAA
ncbi:MAG: chlorophyll synthesis pathway protein BchC [Rubritepida sp.]|nr:chlorophyll synthesis pathway protein BchC [Rubritepida sp.]